ncbi:MAG TPA: hypothetical protein VM261_12905 [Kofleriaceae bacterium]|nr:hypothetical protein [Kofleriaceae bacterium]
MSDPTPAITDPVADPVDDELAAVGAVLVEDRVLRRIIKRHRAIPGLGLQVPHATSYALPRAELAKLVEAGELPVALDRLPERVAVFSGARADLATGGAAAWRDAWRVIFHARIHDALDARALTPAAVRQRINALGHTAFEEARMVLRQEDLLLPPADDTVAYIELVALYLELRHFAPRAVTETFPLLVDLRRVDALVAADVDGAAILAATRPARAPEAADAGVEPAASRKTGPHPTAPGARSISSRVLRSMAEGARRSGNQARAAILSVRAGERDVARADIDALLARLGRVLGDADASVWAAPLLAVADAAAAQSVLRYAASARLLLALQNACIDGERDVEVVDVAAWLRSRGKRKIVRKLPATREIRVARRVRAAARELPGLELDADDTRTRITEAVHAIVDRANARVRAVLRPEIETALAEVKLVPRHLPGQVAQKKLVDELLDKAVAVGRLSLGDLRDAIARNELKLPDLRPLELATGDQLLRADRLLSTSLDGVYRRGEIYLRFLQKVSSVLSGTGIGRLLSLYLLLPLVGAYMIVEGAHHMAAPVAGWFGYLPPHIATKPVLVTTAIIVFLLLHAAWFRSASMTALRTIGRVLDAVFLENARRLWRIRAVRLATRWFLLPGLPALLVWWLVPGIAGWIASTSVFVAIAVITNSAAAEEIVSDWLVRSSRQLARHIIPGLVRYSLEFFSWLIELTARGIYRVDEALRFRPNQASGIVVIKGILATIWFAIAYVLRIYVNLLIEPTVNPVKHFPVVTVAAKLILPFLPAMTTAIAGPVGTVVGPALGASIAAFTVLVLPGIAGFLAWELNSNWKLYRRNRPEHLGPEKLGSHGETMGALLRPGFHSGTLPKLFAKLRRATWKRDDHAVARAREGIHHVEDAVWKFTDRQLVSMLNQSFLFRATDVAVHHVEATSNRLRIELACPSLGAGLATIMFEEQSGWLVAGVPERGWLDAVPADERVVLEVALTGFYKLSGIEVVREQLVSVLAAGGLTNVAYDLTDHRLSVWPGSGFEVELIYDLRSPALPSAIHGTYDGPVPRLEGQHAIFAYDPVATEAWFTTWERLVLGMDTSPLLKGPSLLG